ncbi:hypothetical protein JCM3765_006824, partial [Sporobolomyces pararoseus]
CTEKQVEMEKSSQVLLKKQKKIHAEIDKTYRKRGKVGKGNQTGKKGKALKKTRVDAVNASRSRLRSQQSATFESDRLQKKIGISIDSTKRQLYGGSAFSGAAGINEELQEKVITKIGRVLEKVEIDEGETAETGGGARVHGQHLLDLPAVNLSCRLRNQEREGMSKIVDKFLKKVEIDYNSDEEDELEDSEEEVNEDEDEDIEIDGEDE